MERVLVGCPTYVGKTYCLKEYVEAVKAITYPVDILLVDNSPDDKYLEQIESLNIPVIRGVRVLDEREQIALNRNILRERVLNGGYDAFLSLEQDVIPPPNVVERLLSHNKPCVSGLYYGLRQDGAVVRKTAMAWINLEHAILQKVRQNPQKYPSQYAAMEKHGFDPGELQRGITPEEVRGVTRLIPLKAAGLGCMLIRREILEMFAFRVMNSYDDMAFCTDLRKNGIPLFLDPTVLCRHLIG